MDDAEKSKEQLLRELSELREENARLKKQSVSSKNPDTATGTAPDQNLLHTLVDLMHSFVYVKDLDSRFVFANESCARFMGASSAQELIGKTDSDYYPAEAASIFRSDEIEVIKGISLINKEDIRVSPDGSKRTFLTSKVPLRNRDGKIIGLVGNSMEITEIKLTEDRLRSSEEKLKMDISDRKLMEQKIVESEAYYRTLVDLSPDGIVVADFEGRVSYGSRKMYQILSIPSEVNVMGTSILDWVSPDYHEQLMERVKDILSGNIQIGSREYKLLKYDGSPLWAELSSSPVTDAKGNINGLLVVCRDTTERKKVNAELIRAKEAAEQSDRLKSAFLANMSHEIRTPMNGILGFAELLKDAKLTREEQNEYIKIIEQSGLRMLNILNDLIDISRIESGQMNILFSEFSLKQELLSVYTFFRPMASVKGLNLSVHDKDSIDDVIIKTDREKLNSVLSNLIRNAIKFTLKGYVEFGYKRKNRFIEFFVKDSGVGILPDMKDIIFERFRQGSESLARNYEGAGLGLSISKSFVEMLGGQIRVDSIPGKGTEFYFTIPLSDIMDQENTGTDTAKNTEGIVSGKKLKILIAEDDEASRLLISNIIQPFTKEIIEAVSGKEAVAICRKEEDIDIILMDIKMPEMDGYDATRLIRQFNKNVVIIAQTAFALLGDEQKALTAGCNDYISKPIKKEELLSLLKNHLKKEKFNDLEI